MGFGDDVREDVVHAYLRSLILNDYGSDMLSVSDMAYVASRTGLSIKLHLLKYGAYKLDNGVSMGQITPMYTFKPDLTVQVKLDLKDKVIDLITHYQHLHIAREDALKYGCCGVCYKWFRHADKHASHCVSCRDCGKYYSKGKHHACKATVKVYNNNVRMVKQHSAIEVESWNTNVYFADFETMPLENSNHVVYSASLLHIAEGAEPINMYWEGSTKESDADLYNVIARFMQKMEEISGTVVFYNGSSFDLYFVQQYLLGCKRTDEFKHIIKDNKILYMTFHTVVFFDLYLFTHCSLKRACQEFNIPKDCWKADFDHTKIKRLADVVRYKTEVIPYNNLDVVALKYCYVAFAQKMYSLFRINLNSYITLSHMSYALWTRTLDAEDKIYLPTMEEDALMRKALYGGRTGPQKKQFRSQECHRLLDTMSYDCDIDPIAFFNLTDYLIMLDVVSLYPAQMQKRNFPCGRYRIFKYDEELCRKYPNINKRQKWWVKLINLSHKLSEPLMIIANVDVKCPTDLFIPFLMERGLDGSLLHTLEDKKSQAYCGPELAEAVRLGYRIKRVHWVCEFTESRPLFKDHIELCYELKRSSAKDSLNYAIAKRLMNSLSGKMSQKVFTTEWKLTCEPAEGGKILSTLYVDTMRYLRSLKEDYVGYAFKVATDNPQPTKPVYLGVFILAYARCDMSRYMRLCKGYKHPFHTYHYTDTDSLVLHNLTVDKYILKSGTYGKELGCLDNELNGGRIVKAVFLAPKTYLLEYVSNSKPHRLMWKVRCKGIPHQNEPVDVFKYLVGVEDGKTGKPGPYQLIDKDKKPVGPPSTVITYNMFDAVLNKGCDVKVTFQILQKSLYNATICSGQYSSVIRTVQCRRSLHSNRWWLRGHRVPLPDTDVTVPKGHKLYTEPTI